LLFCPTGRPLSRASCIQQVTQLGCVPPERRLFVANHDAFGYFLARYGITLVGDVVPSTDFLAAVRPAHVAVVDGKLFADAIGDPGTPGGTLEGALVQNARVMAAGFTSC
jgi:hypothetical protein